MVSLEAAVVSDPSELTGEPGPGGSSGDGEQNLAVF